MLLRSEPRITSNHVIANWKILCVQTEQMDGRSDDKGLEVESLTIASICDKHYLFVGAERTSTIFVFDITVTWPHSCTQQRTCARMHHEWYSMNIMIMWLYAWVLSFMSADRYVRTAACMRMNVNDCFRCRCITKYDTNVVTCVIIVASQVGWLITWMD